MNEMVKADSKEHFIETWSQEIKNVVGFFPINEDTMRFFELRDEIIEMIKRKADFLERKGVFK